MVRRPVRAVATTLVAVLSSMPIAAAARPVPSATPTGPSALPATYVVVDVDTGNIVAQSDARTLHLPASTIKLLTALIAAEQVPASATVQISALAESMPARKINVKAGQTWTFTDLMHCMLMISANDAAVAIAERTGGSVQGWATLAAHAAERLGLADHPQLVDPAGLDDKSSQGGGTWISARDLAIVARAVLARPDLMHIIQTKDYSFTGGDNLAHHFTNHDLFLGLYAGATGMKTGTTDRAGSTFVGSATRGGRSMLTVIFNGADPYGQAGELLDKGFATPVSAESAVDALPKVVPNASATTTTAPAPGAAVVAAHPASSGGGIGIDSPPIDAAVLFVGLLVALRLRRRIQIAHRAREASER